MITTQRTLEQIEKEITETKQALENVKGTETEVYARIVGYYRSVRNWNKGKKDEYKQRKVFEVSNFENQQSSFSESDTTTKQVKLESSVVLNIQKEYTYEFYGRTTCPNCPIVKEYVINLPLKGSLYDVDSEIGFAKASSHGVLSAPTVIIYDNSNKEIARAHSIEELDEILNPILSNCEVAF